MAKHRIASALSHQDDTTGFVPGIGYEEGNMSLSTDAIIVDIEASLDCLYGEDVDLDWEQMLAPVSLGEGIMFNACDATEPNISDPQTIMDECACAQSTYWASIGGVDCAAIPTMYFYHPDYLGSVEFVTDMNGDPYQFFFNTIWGENLQNQLAFNTTAFSSRFRFNPPSLKLSRAGGKEWDEETGNFYYGARYYDPQISVWLSVDRYSEKYSSLTGYDFMGGNPLSYIDPTGDTLEVAQNQETYDDIKSLLTSGDQQYLKFNNGYVTLDFGQMTQADIDQKLDGDVGLLLVYLLVNSDKTYYYLNGNSNTGQIRSGGTVNVAYHKDQYGNQYDFINNMSITPRNANGGAGTQGLKPLNHDGEVRISPGSFERRQANGQYVPVPRSSVVFHELMENFLRTSLNYPYTRLDGSGAHDLSKKLEGNRYTPYTDGPVKFTP